MISFRPFLNTDPPLLVEIWRDQKRFPCMASSITVGNLEDLLFGKPYFEAAGLILAFENDRPVGFVHAGFGETIDGNDLERTAGVISMIRVVPECSQDEVIQGLMDRAIKYLRERGSQQVNFGSRFPNSPFYLGLYGGSRIPGIVNEDEVAERACQQLGFQESSRVAVFRRSMVGFRTVVDRRQMKVRRAFQIRANADPSLKTWNEACTMGRNMRMRFSLIDRKDESVRGSVSYWDMEPLATSWGVCAMGMYNLKVDDEARRAGLATFLVGESLRHLASQSIGIVEAQTSATNEATCGLLEKLGFEKAAEARQMILELD
jgi:ribosomal protein S18 acetylase RimI-like enzyme